MTISRAEGQYTGQVKKMQNKKLLKRINIWLYIIPFLAIIVLFTMATYSSVRQKLNESYEHFKDDAVDAARNYSFSLKKSTEAAEIIDHLLDKRLLTAGKTVMLAKNRFSQEVVKALALSLEVDQICVHNSTGSITYSNVDSYVGWQAEPGHPVHNFMISGKDQSLDEIRADTVSGEYYKYAYYRLPSGEFVQIGISAMDVKKVLGDFETGRLLEELNEDPNIDQISLINNERVIIESSKPELKGTAVNSPEAILAVYEGKDTAGMERSGKKVLYNSFIPLRREGEVTGALFVSSRQKEAAYFAAEELKNSIWVLATALLSAGGILLMLYRNNKNYLKLAYYDTNTGLPNHESLKYFLETLSKEGDWRGSIMMLNFSHLPGLSLLYGSDYAEKVFAEIAGKLRELFDEDGITFSVGNDRIVIYSDGFDSPEKTGAGLDKVKDLFRTHTFSDQKILMPVEIGVAEFSKEEDPSHIFKKALIAMSRVKEDAHVSYQYFNSEMEALLERENTIEKEIMLAVNEENEGKEGSIYVLFQPQAAAGSGRITGFETLARMRSKTLGDVSPAEFIQIAERNRLISPLTRLIMKKAALFIKSMKNEQGRGVRVAVNISGADLMRADFVDDMKSLIEEEGIQSSDLEFEITESVFMEDFGLINEKLGIIRELGIKVSIDDFGTGYSSLSRLRDLNIDIVKIDKQFIDKIDPEIKQELVIPDIISMAHKIGLKVVAEGVEEEAQREYLAGANCDVIQGYLFSRPIAPEEALELLAQKS